MHASIFFFQALPNLSFKSNMNLAALGIGAHRKQQMLLSNIST